MSPVETAVNNISKEERLYLREHIAVLNADSVVQSAREQAGSKSSFFTIEAFWNGVEIDGFACRITVGTMALLRVAKSRCLGYGDSLADLSPFDIALAVFLISDENRNEAVSLANKKDELSKAVKRFQKRINVPKASDQLIEYLSRISDAFKSPDEFDEEGNVIEVDVKQETFEDIDDSWSTDVDTLAHEYGWSDKYILWELPIIRVVRLKEAIVARLSPKKRVRKYNTGAIDILKALEKRSKEIKTQDNE